MCNYTDSSISALRDIYNQEDDFISQAQYLLREYLTVQCSKNNNFHMYFNIYIPI